jgi:hypothetical protein
MFARTSIVEQSKHIISVAVYSISILSTPRPLLSHIMYCLVGSMRIEREAHKKYDYLLCAAGYEGEELLLPVSIPHTLLFLTVWYWNHGVVRKPPATCQTHDIRHAVIFHHI